MNSDVVRLAGLIENAKNIVFFGGAGVSTPSGIPDFRSAHGLYNAPGGRSYEEMLSISTFTQRPDAFWNFYRSVMLYPNAKPNPAHFALARLEKCGKLKAVVTQNIDGLHQAAGGKRVLELHGSVHRNRCMRCGKRYTLEELPAGDGAAVCTGRDGHPCGGLIKPDVVLYGEPLDGSVMEAAIEAIQACDLLIVGGTSLVVQPAAGLIAYRRPGAVMALINRDATPYDSMARLILHEDIAEALSAAVPLGEDGGADV